MGDPITLMGTPVQSAAFARTLGCRFPVVLLSPCSKRFAPLRPIPPSGKPDLKKRTRPSADSSLRRSSSAPGQTPLKPPTTPTSFGERE